MWQDFKAFLLKANVVALALAVIIGGAAGALVTAMVDDFIMPIIGAATPAGAWREWALTIGPMTFGVGHFLGVFVNFAIVSFVAWRIAKAFVKPDPAPPPTKVCPHCKNTVPLAATRCGFCTSTI
jgi:large conductance mechanosensitive channel